MLYNSNISFAQNFEDNSDVDNSDVDNSDVDNSDVDNSDVDNSDVDNSDVDNSDVDNSDVDNSDVDNSDVDNSDVDNSDVDNSDVDNSDVDNSDVDNSDNLENIIDPKALINNQPSSSDDRMMQPPLNNPPDAIVKPGGINLKLNGLEPPSDKETTTILGIKPPPLNNPPGAIVKPGSGSGSGSGSGAGSGSGSGAGSGSGSGAGSGSGSGAGSGSGSGSGAGSGSGSGSGAGSGSGSGSGAGSGSGSGAGSGSGSGAGSGSGSGSGAGSGSGSGAGSGSGSGSGAGSGSGSGAGSGSGSGSGAGSGSGSGSGAGSGSGSGSGAGSGSGSGGAGSGSGSGAGSGSGSGAGSGSGSGAGSGSGSGAGSGSGSGAGSGSGSGAGGLDSHEPSKPEKPFDIMTTVSLNITDTEKIKTDVGGQPIPFQYIIIFDDIFTANPNSLATTFQALSLTVESLGGEVFFTYNNAISGMAFKTVDQQKSDQILDILSLDPRVKFIEQDRIVVPFSQLIPSGIQRIGIENVSTNSDIEHSSIDADIAIIDSGIDLDHPDLNVFKSVTSIIPQILSSKDNTLRAKDINLNKIGLNVENNLATFYPPFFQVSRSTGDDNCGHGTHVAGIAAAKDNSFGVIGVSPGAKLWAIKVLDYDKNSGKCFGSISSVIAAIDYVTKNADQIDVANLSLGCKCNSTALDEAISESVVKNVVYVTAAGNIHADASSFSPANHNDVLTVSAIADADGKCGSLGTPLWVDAGDFSGFSNDDTFASFSNYGSVVDIAAPGVKINSTYLNGTYALMGGTSIASPHVTGIVALFKSINPTASPKDISEKLTIGGLHPNTVCDGHSYGYFDQDLDNSPEPLLHSFDMVNIKVDDSNFKGDPNFWNNFSDITELR